MTVTTSPSPIEEPTAPRRRALVLGGAGSAGNAWSIGIIAGLARAGIDATAAELIIGTSAGATTAAQITAAPPAQLLEAILSAPLPPGPRSHGSRPPRGDAGAVAAQLARTQRIIDQSSDAADMRRRMGAAAIDLAAATPDAGPRWRRTVATRLPDEAWPDRRMLITTVDATTGEPVVFTRDSGVDLVDAVAASCASGFAYGIGAEHYIGGGYRSNAENADLATGYSRVLVLAPFGGASRVPAAWGTHLSDQVAVLRAEGSIVETIFPDDEARAAFGTNVMDPSTRAPAARAGFAQGMARATTLLEMWD